MKSRTALFGLFIIFLRIESAAGPDLRREKVALTHRTRQRESRSSELQCPAAEKEARTGDTETLRFLMKPGMDVFKDLTVECLYRDVDSETPRDFFVFRQGEEDLKSQDETFKGKTVLLSEEPSSGNFSLKMTVDRPGTYCCTVKDEVNKDSCSTNLTVRAREQDPEKRVRAHEQDPVTPSNPTDGDRKSDPVTGMDPGTIGGGIGIIIVIIIIILSIFIVNGILVYIHRRRMVNQGTEEERIELEGNGDPEAAPEAEASSVPESSVAAP